MAKAAAKPQHSSGIQARVRPEVCALEEDGIGQHLHLQFQYVGKTRMRELVEYPPLIAKIAKGSRGNV